MIRVKLDDAHEKNGAISKNSFVHKLMGKPGDLSGPSAQHGRWWWSVLDPLATWLEENCYSEVKLHLAPAYIEYNYPNTQSPYWFYLDFVDDREATLFKLTWGGRAHSD